MKKRDPVVSKKPWNVLVYLAGGDDLSEEMVWSLQEMRRAASLRAVQESLHLVALFDPNGRRPRRYDVLAPGSPPPEEEYGELEALAGPSPESGSPDEPVSTRVARFLSSSLTALPPASHEALILSGHGSGAASDFLPDGDSSSALTVPELQNVLARHREASGRPIELLGMDSCQMSGLELAYEIRGVVRFLVASEGPVRRSGWPYHRVLQAMAAESTGGVEPVARAIVSGYLDFYGDYELVGLATDIAATDLSKIESVAAAFGELAGAIRASLARLAPDGLEEAFELGRLRRSYPEPEVDSARAVRNAILLAHWSAQSYKCDRYVDLYDFCDQLSRFAPSSTAGDRLRTGGESVKRAIESAVFASGTTGAGLQHSHGLSLFFPWSPADDVHEYARSRFARATGWGELLETYLAATARMRRSQEVHVERGDRPEPAEISRPVFELAPLVRDADAGTHRGYTCRSTMKNPPRGYYRRRRDR